MLYSLEGFEYFSLHLKEFISTQLFELTYNYNGGSLTK